MLRVRALAYLQIRGVRTNMRIQHRPPYPFFFRCNGWTEIGPYYHQKWEWPDKDSGWSVLPPSFPDQPEPSFVDDSKSQKFGYPHPLTNEFVTVEDARPEIIVPPDLDDCKLKPYVSFRTSETEANAPAITAKDLFDIFYAEKVSESFREGKYAKSTSLFAQQVGDDESRKKVLMEKGIPVVDDGLPLAVPVSSQ